MMQPKKGTGSHWWVRLVLALLTAVIATVGFAAPAHAEDCKPPGVPSIPGHGLPGEIDGHEKSVTDPKTKYGQYGWAGLQWHVCDLGDGSWGEDFVPEFAKDGDAYMDTAVGNFELGVSNILAAFMTQLHEWVADPAEIMSPVDGSITDINDAVKKSTWTPWASAVIILSACFVASWANRGDIRRASRTVAAILIALLVMGLMSHDVTVTTYPDREPGRPGQPIKPVKEQVPGALAMAQQFDGIASEVVDSVDSALMTNSKDEVVGSAEARGATLHDKLLYKIWATGAVGSGNDEVAQKLYEQQAVKWDDAKKVDVSKNQEAYKNIANSLKDSNQAAYKQLTGKARGRGDMGLLALLYMLVIAIVRIPAELMILAGLLVVRIAVMLSPLFALAAMVEKTRPIAIAALKMVFAAVYNSAVFGVIAAVHTAITTAVINANTNSLVQGLVMTIGLTIVIMAASKPFRSVTVPATGEAAAQAMSGGVQGLISAPGQMVRSAAGMAAQVAAISYATRSGTKTGTSEAYEEAAEGHTAEAEDVPVRTASRSRITPEILPARHEEQVTAQERAEPASAVETAPRVAYGWVRDHDLPTAERYELPPRGDEMLVMPRYELPEGPGGAGAVEAVPPDDSVSPLEDVELRQRLRMHRDFELIDDGSIFRPGRDLRQDPMTITAEAVDVTEVVPVKRHIEPEVTRDGEVTYDVWRPDAEPVEGAVL